MTQKVEILKDYKGKAFIRLECIRKRTWVKNNFMGILLRNLFSGSILLQRRQWHPTPVLFPGRSHGRRSLVDCSPWSREESDTTEWLHFPFSLSCIGEGNGNPLQCSCLENPRDRGAWWAAVSGVAQSGHDWSEFAAAAAACFSIILLNS